jgi:phosphatidylglycerol:prolipoprotein diacylglycerol transferase
MIPFLHLGPLTIPTYGLMVAVAMLVAYFVLRADLARRGIAADAEMFIAIPTLAGIAGAKVYHVLETPQEFFAHPVNELFSQFGFAWFGGLIAGFGAWVWLARREKVPLLTMLDAGSPAAALGYGIGRIGCFLSGDGDYGVPTSLPWGMSFPNGLVPTSERVHPTPIYELIAACAIAWILWQIGGRQLKTGLLGSNRSFSPGTSKDERDGGRAKLKPGEAQQKMGAASEDARRRQALAGLSGGSVFAAYLVLTGVARFLVEFIRINPRSVLAGTPLAMTNAQAASVASIVAGAVIWRRVRARLRVRVPRT